MIPLRDDNPVRGIPVVTIAIILINVAVFLWQLSLSADAAQAVVYRLGFMPALLFGYAELAQRWVAPGTTIITSMFLHGGFLHLAGNMLYLWIFGDNIEDRVGHFRFVVFYLLCGALAAFAQALPDVRSTLPMIGASGAISGVLGAYLVLYPRTNVLVVVPLFVLLYTVRVPAMFVLGFWFIAQLGGSLFDQSGGGVAFTAHIGGFVAGAALVRWFLLERRRPRS
jgi:rhomboid family protein